MTLALIYVAFGLCFFLLGWVFSFLNSQHVINSWKHASAAWKECALLRGEALGLERPTNDP